MLADGDSVAVIDDLSTGYEHNISGLPIDFIRGSILDPGALAEAAAGADAIVHLGALGSVPRSISDPVASHAANATGTLMVLDAARREGAYVTAASSSSVYGSVPDLPRTEEQPTRPMSPTPPASSPPRAMCWRSAARTTWKRCRSGASTSTVRASPPGTRTPP